MEGLPATSRDEFGEELLIKQNIEHHFNLILNQAHFFPIATPFLEKGETPHPDSMYLSGKDGELFTLKSDMTRPLSRFLATNHINYPAHLYYFGETFTPPTQLSGHYNQQTQAGFEIIGETSWAAEQEILQQTLNLMAELDVTDLEIELSDAKLADAVLATYQLSPQQITCLKDALFNKNMTQYRQKLKAYHLIDDTFLVNWPMAFGLRGDALLPLLPDSPEINAMKTHWQELINSVKAFNSNIKVHVDLAARPLKSYYTGTTIRTFSQHVSEYIFSGGRYDQLLRDHHGCLLPAVGIGINVDALATLKAHTNKQQPEKDNLTFVLAKGRVEKAVRPLLKNAGIDNSALENPERKLIFHSNDNKLTFILVKADDVVKYLDAGIGDIGIVGSDTMAEQPFNHYDLLDLNVARAQFVLASTHDFRHHINMRPKIATKYPTITREYFDKQNKDIQIIKLTGSVELAPLTDLADAIVDISQTGTTLKENNLKVLDELNDVSAHLIANRISVRQQRAFFNELIYNLLNILEPNDENLSKSIN